MTQTPFQEMAEVVRSGDESAIRRFIEQDPSRLHVDYPPFGTCLHYAATTGNAGVVRSLVDLGADINQLTKYRESPLVAALNGKDEHNLEIVHYLLSLGATTPLDNLATNPYLIAIGNGRRDLVQILLDHDVNPHVVSERSDGSLRNALSYAIDRGETEIAEILKAHGCTAPPGYEPPDDGITADVRVIVDHLGSQFGKAEPYAFQTLLPDPAGVVIHYIKADDEHPFATLFTTGMSRHRMDPPAGAAGFEHAELVFHLGPNWPDLSDPDWQQDPVAMWPVQLIKAIAVYPILSDTWLGPFSTVALSDPPRPLGPLTELSAVLLRPDQIPPLSLPEKQIDFYTIYPIYREELELAQTEGARALVARLDAAGVSRVLKANRDSTCS